MRVKSTFIVLIVIALTVALGLGAYYGFSVGGKEIIPCINGIRKGLDVAGGVRLIYSVEGENINEDIRDKGYMLLVILAIVIDNRRK